MAKPKNPAKEELKFKLQGLVAEYDRETFVQVARDLGGFFPPFNDEVKADLHADFRAGKTCKEISVKYGLSLATVNALKKGSGLFKRHTTDQET
jgi:hypothetical protein